MIVASTSAPVRWTPPWMPASAELPAFFVRAGSVLEREMLEAELDGVHRAGRLYPFELRAAFDAGVDALVGSSNPEDAARLKEVRLAADTLEKGETLPADERAMIDAAEEVLHEHWPAFRELKARAARRAAIAPVLAFRRFCTGWENVQSTFKRGPDGFVADDALRTVDPLLLTVCGRFAYNLLYATDRGNSDAPSQSGAIQSPSPSGPRAKAAGRSKASTGRKTPSSRSRAGRSAS